MATTNEDMKKRPTTSKRRVTATVKVNAWKLTDENGRTYNNTQWGHGVSHTVSGEGPLCGPGWLHYYDDLLLAVMLNPVHANFRSPRAWEAVAEGTVKEDHGLKFGCMKLTTLKEVPVPVVSVNARVRFGILCAMEVTEDKVWRAWAEKWLKGETRTQEAARAAAAQEAAAVETSSTSIDLHQLAAKAVADEEAFEVAQATKQAGKEM